MEKTPKSNRIHIGIFGKTNAGKSSFLNRLCRQEISITSPERGTTTDPVSHAMEISPLGACVLIDTAGFDDQSTLGQLRIKKTRQVMEKVDVAILLLREQMDIEQEWIAEWKRRKTPYLLIYNYEGETLPKKAGLPENILYVNALTGEGFERFYQALEKIASPLEKENLICGDLVQAGDLVLLVMPQDIQAPKGRLILPQVQTIRELLDRQCLVQCVTGEQVEMVLDLLKIPPKLIITDSQIFAKVAAIKPESSMLTSFSVLFSKQKGDMEAFVEGAQRLRQLPEDAKILIAEACSHKPLQEDIGRVKLPRLLRQKLGSKLQIAIASGADFPEKLRDYDLIIHCGACMFHRKHVMSRVTEAKEQGVPITNYGLAIAALTGILDQISY